MDRAFIFHYQIWLIIYIITLLKCTRQWKQTPRGLCWVDGKQKQFGGDRLQSHGGEVRIIPAAWATVSVHILKSWNHFLWFLYLVPSALFPWRRVVSCLTERGDTVWSYEVMSQRGCWDLWAPGEGAQVHSSKEVQTHSGGWWIWQLILVCLTAGTFFASFITSGKVFHTCAM